MKAQSRGSVIYDTRGQPHCRQCEQKSITFYAGLCTKCHGEKFQWGSAKATGAMALLSPFTHADVKTPARPKSANFRSAADLISECSFDVEIRLHNLRSWVQHSQAKWLVGELGSGLTNLYEGDARSLASDLDITLEWKDRPTLYTSARGEVDGCAWPSKKLAFIANDLAWSREEHVIAHELAHCLLTIACDSTPEGEELAEAFATSFARRQPWWRRPCER